jgi:hypothetical protein
MFQDALATPSGPAPTSQLSARQSSPAFGGAQQALARSEQQLQVHRERAEKLKPLLGEMVEQMETLSEMDTPRVTGLQRVITKILAPGRLKSYEARFDMQRGMQIRETVQTLLNAAREIRLLERDPMAEAVAEKAGNALADLLATEADHQSMVLQAQLKLQTARQQGLDIDEDAFMMEALGMKPGKTLDDLIKTKRALTDLARGEKGQVGMSPELMVKLKMVKPDDPATLEMVTQAHENGVQEYIRLQQERAEEKGKDEEARRLEVQERAQSWYANTIKKWKSTLETGEEEVGIWIDDPNDPNKFKREHIKQNLLSGPDTLKLLMEAELAVIEAVDPEAAELYRQMTLPYFEAQRTIDKEAEGSRVERIQDALNERMKAVAAGG